MCMLKGISTQVDMFVLTTCWRPVRFYIIYILTWRWSPVASQWMVPRTKQIMSNYCIQQNQGTAHTLDPFSDKTASSNTGLHPISPLYQPCRKSWQYLLHQDITNTSVDEKAKILAVNLTFDIVFLITVRFCCQCA